MGNQPDPMEPLKILGQRVCETLNAMGLQVENFAVLPNITGGPHFAQIVVSLDPDAVNNVIDDDAQRKADDEMLAAMEQQMKKEKEQEKEDAARAGLEKLAQQLEEGEGKGIL